MAEWRRRNKDKMRRYNETKKLRDVVRWSEWKKQDYIKHSERYKARAKAWYNNNKERHRARYKEYCKRRPDIIRACSRRHYFKYHAENLARGKLFKKRYIEKNRAKVAASAHFLRTLRRQRIKFLGDTSDRAAIISFVSELKSKPDVVCSYCLTPIFGKMVTVDHKIPIARGGIHAVSNLCPACRRCNSSKGNKTPEEFLLFKQSVEASLNNLTA